MLSERLQVLVSRAQRRRLESEARARRTSVGALIREAVDARVRGAPPAERRKALDAIRQMAGGRYLSPAALDRIVEDERDGAFAAAKRGRSRK